MYAIPEFPETAWRGAFARWREIVEPITDCPLPYHFGNLLAILSAQMGDLAVLDEGVEAFLNFFIFSYGRTGTRKSTAMDLATQHLVRKFDARHFVPLPSINSAEGLIRVLATPPHNVLLYYDEVKHLFSVANRNGSAIEPVINKAFGLGELGTCVRAASESLAGVPYFLTLICNGTPVHISMDVNEAMFKGGLLNRFLVFAANPSPRHLPRLGKPDIEKVDDFVQRLNMHIAAWRNFAGVNAAGRLNRAVVRVGMSDEAFDVFEPWDRDHDRKTKTDNELTADPVQRITLYAKKIASMFCLWELPTPELEPKITAPQMQAAIDVAMFCQASILFMSSIWTIRTTGARGEALAEERLELHLRDHGCTNERMLSKHMHMSIGEVKKAAAALASIDTVALGTDSPRTIHYRDKCQCPTMPHFALPTETTPVLAAPFEEPSMYAPEE